MANGRMVLRRISTSEQLGRVSLQADLLFTKCIAQLDVDGRITGNPVLLKAQVLPLRPEITADSIPGLISELEASIGHEGDPLVMAYEVNGLAVLLFPGFARIQKVRTDREATSKFPPPPERPTRRRKKAGVLPESSRVDPADAGRTPLQGEGEGEGEGKGEGEVPAGGWPAQVASILSEHCGPTTPGECGAALKSQLGQFSPEEVVRAAVWFAKYSTDKPQFKTVRTLAKQLPQWVKRSALVQVYDPVSGDPTPEAAAILGMRS